MLIQRYNTHRGFFATEQMRVTPHPPLTKLHTSPTPQNKRDMLGLQDLRLYQTSLHGKLPDALGSLPYLLEVSHTGFRV
jgi:hypothetical protein